MKTKPDVVHFCIGVATIEDTRTLDVDAFALFILLLVLNVDRDFPIADDMRHLMSDGGWSLRRFTKAASRLIDRGFLVVAKPAPPQSVMIGEHSTIQ